MKKNIISWLSFMAVFGCLLQSCIHDEFTNSENPSKVENSTTAKYSPRSPWKEDEIYINKVQQVFLKHANPEYVNFKYGELYWNYAMSFGQFGERYALVPVIKDDKVVLLMEAVRKDNKVYFYEKNDSELINFFHTVIFSDITSFDEIIHSSAKGLSYACTTRTVTVGCPDGVPNCTPMNTTSTVCEWVFTSGTPPKGFDPIGDPDAGGGGSGYEYPTPPDDEYLDPCEKIKLKFIETKFKEKVATIDKPEVFAYDHEMGYASAYPVNTTVTDIQYQPMENSLGTHSVELPDGDQYFGFMHSHNDESDGGFPIKMFSPADLATFLTSCVANAEMHGSIGDAYTMVITSEGNYMLQYTGLSSGFGIGPNTIKFWKTWYDREMGKLILSDELTQPNIEKVFLRFLKEKVKIDGIELYQIEKVIGKAKKLSLDDNNVIPTPCP